MLSSTPFRTVSTVALAIALVGGAVALGGVVALDQHGDTGSDADTQQSTYLRVAHASPDAPAVDVTVGNETVLSDVEFGAVSEYLSLEAGTYNVTIAAADDPDTVLFDEEVTFEPRSVTTVSASGEVGEDAETAFQPVAFQDDGFTPGENESALSVVHLAPDASAVDVTTANGSVVLADNVSYQNASDYVTVPSGNYTVEIREEAEGDNGSVLTTVDVALDGGTAYSAFAAGYLTPDDEPADTPFEVVLEEDATMTLELPGDAEIDDSDEADDGGETDEGSNADDATDDDDGAAGDNDGDTDDGDDADSSDGEDDGGSGDDGADSSTEGGPETIEECRTIDQPGTYEVTQDIGSTNVQSIDLGNGMVRQACIAIQSSDVVLDGGGSVLSGSGEDLSVGIHVYDPAGSPVQNVTIRDLQIEDWSNGVQVGVDVWAVNSAAAATASIENVQSNDNDHSGFFLVGSGIELSAVVANDNGGSGIGVFHSDGMQVTGSTTTGNAEHGVALLAEVFDGTFTDVTTTNNDGAEIYIGEPSSGNEFTGLTFGTEDDSVQGYDDSQNTIDQLPEEPAQTESDGEVPDENEDAEGEDPTGNESADDESGVDAGNGTDTGDGADAGNETDTGDGADTGNETGEGGGADDGDVADDDETETDGSDGTDGGEDSDTQTDGDDEADGDDGVDDDEEAEGGAETDSNDGTDTGTDGGDGIDADDADGDGGADGVNATS